MSTLQQERDLLVDRDLHRKLAAATPKANAPAWPS
jgi:hypothetical protein